MLYVFLFRVTTCMGRTSLLRTKRRSPGDDSETSSPSKSRKGPSQRVESSELLTRKRHGLLATPFLRLVRGSDVSLDV